MAKNTREPELQDFGVTPEEYALYKGQWGKHPWEESVERLWLPGSVVIAMVVACVTIQVNRDLGAVLVSGIVGFVVGGIVMVGPVTSAVEAIVRPMQNRKRSRLLESPVASQIKLYEKAMATYTEEKGEAERQQREAERVRRTAEKARQEAERARRRKLIEHWLALSGPELEDEMATLCSRLGYRVESTPVSGDGGVDLILRNKSCKNVVVQCKSYKSPVGPAAARELYGSLMHFGADKAVLVCPAGFTRGVEEFVKGKKIDLVSASDLISLAASAEPMENGGENGIGQ